MKVLFTILALSFFATFTYADTTCDNKRLDEIERSVKQIDANQLNYRIEKDLLKETYRNNYEKINLFMTILLGVMGILGYLGLKDISSIKREYETELNKLRQIEGQFNLKSQEFDSEKKKFDDELKSIIKDNEEQSRKIKLIELKEQIRNLLKENNVSAALEFTNVALDISKNDAELLNNKGRILSRLNQFSNAVDVFLTGIKENPEDNITIMNAAECLYFAKRIEDAKKLVNDHKNLFESDQNVGILELFDIYELFFGGNKEKLLEIAKSYINANNLKTSAKRIKRWDLIEANYFVHFQPESELKTILQNIIWYWDGQITGEALLTNLKIALPMESK